MRRIILIVSVAICVALLMLVLCSVQAQPLQDPGQPGPYVADYVVITTTNPSTGSELVTDIHYPSSGGGVDPSGAPYATLVFAHGFMASPSGYTGHGEHLASWGYIVALPDFPDDDVEVRASDVQHLFSYLEAENANGASPFFQTIDTARLGMAGHSLGGMSTLMVTARDARVNMAGVPLDPAGGMLGNWDYETEAPSITVPSVVIGAPPQLCNSSGEYNDWYPHIGATHKAKFVITDGSHCDFMSTDDEGQTNVCGLLCGEYSPERSEIAQHYMTAWFNYYLSLDTDYYTYLYGAEADADIQAGLITRTVDTAPRDVVAVGGFGAVELGWTLYDHPIISGYNIYRSQESGNYPSSPYAQVGRQTSYTDTGVVAGEEYFYVIRSRDSAGNEHQASEEVSAVVSGAPAAPGVPTLLAPPDGTITTTGTSSATILSLDVHTWTVGDSRRAGVARAIDDRSMPLSHSPATGAKLATYR